MSEKKYYFQGFKPGGDYRAVSGTAAEVLSKVLEWTDWDYELLVDKEEQ